MSDLLFCKHDWFSVKEHQTNNLKEEVAKYDGNRLLNTSVPDMCSYLVEKYRVNVPTLNKTAIVADQREAKIDVSHDFRYAPSHDGRPNLVDGTTIEITIPFDGDSQAFFIQPTTSTFNPPCASVGKNLLTFAFTGIDQTSGQVRAQFDRTIEEVESYLSNLNRDANAFNASLHDIALKAVEARRAKLLNNQSLVASLGFAVKSRADMPQTYVAPSIKRKIIPTPPSATTSPYKPEPCLSGDDYSHILEVVQNMARVMECSPSAFTSMDEEALRTHFLVQLNGRYEGQATGETFNFEGKTDILIRVEGKNIFIAECKFWHGPQKMIETLDQLLRYASWRDTKVAVIVFNRNKDFTKVLDSIQKTVSQHSNCKRVMGPLSETSFRYIFSHRDDSNREMILTVLAFEVPSA